MGKFELLVVLALACVAASEAAGILSKLSRARRMTDPDMNRWECYSEMSHCENKELDEKFDDRINEDNIHEALANRTLLAEIAAALQATSDCQDEVAASDKCVGVDDLSERTVGFVASYMQTPGAIDSIVAMSGSECLSNEEKQQKAGAAVVACFLHFNELLGGGGDVCRHVASLWQCAVQTASRVCGEAVGQFIHSVAVHSQSLTDGSDLLSRFATQTGLDLAGCSHAAMLQSGNANAL